jgi:hypothetical protein
VRSCIKNACFKTYLPYISAIRSARQQENFTRTSFRADVKFSGAMDYVTSVNLHAEETECVAAGGTRNSPGKINTSLKFWQ